ncbi:MAG: adenylate/guanylate cyclase domain-containing protein [Eudoraea sp.]|uniref:adenylate/guanylate cyclase domain-containing protein n=1 Tax=Eudoraea sp. TaxID=1979955 RepID=UPI003263F6A9
MLQTRQLNAIMFTDIVGYTALMGKDTDKALELLRLSMEIQKQLVEQYNGKWLKEMGDGSLASFNSALDAVNCSIAIQESARSKINAKLRIGIHLGDITIENNDIFGDGVNVASRLESIADPGGIYISDNIEKSIKGQTNVQAKYLGEIKLKNVAYNVRTYALQGSGLPVPQVEEYKEISGRFLAAVQRRGVIRVAITYLAFSLFLMLLLPYVGTVVALPIWSSTALQIILVLGFLIAMYLAWNYERSPKGFVRTSSQQSWQNPNKGSQSKPLTSNLIIILLVVASAVLYFYPRSPGTQEKVASEIIDKSIAVIPFDDMSPGSDQKYLADGMQEAILNHLAKIKDMRVISRTTMEAYRESNKSTPSIARDVGVSYILEGSIQRIANKVRITVQLIQGNSDKHLWSENYDRDLSDIFTIQTEIAKRVAKELNTTISVKDRTLIETIPTTNLTAYDYYLKGMDFRNRSNEEEDLRFAAQMFSQAIEIDSTFTLAWVGLASTSRSTYWYRFNRTEELLVKTKQYLDRAIALDPDNFEVRLEAGKYHYQCKLDYGKALPIFEKLRSEYPNNSQLYAWTGYIYRRMGNFEKSFNSLDRAILLNPSSWNERANAAYTLVILGRYGEAEDYYTTVLDLNPSWDDGYSSLVELYQITGKIEQARRFTRNKNPDDHPWMYMTMSKTELLERNYDEAIRIIEASPSEFLVYEDEFIPRSQQLGLIYLMMSNRELATTHFQEARLILEDKLKELPDDPRLYSSLGIVYAGLGLKEEAVKAGNKALSIINFSVDAIEGYYRELDMARILTMNGRYDEAIKKLEFLLQRNGHLSMELLKRDPFWDPLRDINEFKELIENPKYQLSL